MPLTHCTLDGVCARSPEMCLQTQTNTAAWEADLVHRIEGYFRKATLREGPTARSIFLVGLERFAFCGNWAESEVWC